MFSKWTKSIHTLQASVKEWDELFLPTGERIYISTLQWARGRHCIKIGTKDEKGEKVRLWWAYALCPSSQRLTFISTLLLLNSCFFPPGSGSGCGSGGGGVRGGGGGEDGPSMDLPDIFCSLGSLIAEGRLPRWEQQKWNESTFHRNIGNWVSGEWFQFLWVFCHPSWQAVCYRTPEKPSSVPHCINKDISWVHWPFHLILIKCVMFCWSLWYQWLQLRNCVPRIYMYKGTSPCVPDSISLVGGISRSHPAEPYTAVPANQTVTCGH